MNKKRVFGIVGVIVLILIGCYFIFGIDNYVKAHNAGVSVKYFQDPKYCVEDDDCLFMCDHPTVNKYNGPNGLIACTDRIRNYYQICNNNYCEYISNNINITTGRNIE